MEMGVVDGRDERAGWESKQVQGRWSDQTAYGKGAGWKRE